MCCAVAAEHAAYTSAGLGRGGPAEPNIEQDVREDDRHYPESDMTMSIMNWCFSGDLGVGDCDVAPRPAPARLRLT